MASCLTVAALPVLLREGNQQRAERVPTVAAVAPGGETLARPLVSTADAPGTRRRQTLSSNSAPTDANTSTTEDVVNFLAGSTTTHTTPKTVTVAVPAPLPDTTQSGTASYRRWAPGSAWAQNPCAAWFLKVGTTATVTNLDNGHTVTCVVVDRTNVPKESVIVLDTELFALLADLVEAPIPVRISWK